MIRLITALVAIPILFAAAGCDLELPAMPLVGEEAGGNAGEPVPTAAPPDASTDAATPDPPGPFARVGMMALSIGPVGLLLIAGAVLAIYLGGRSKRRNTQ